MWIKLKKHIAEGSIWYTLPSDDNELKFIEGDLISYKIEPGDTKQKHPIRFRYVPWLRTINGIHHCLELKCPFINSPASIIELDEILVNYSEIKKYYGEEHNALRADLFYASLN